MNEHLSNIAESLTVAQDLREQPHVKDALKPYLSELSLARHPELRDPADRRQFMSLLLSNVLPAGKALKSIQRKDLNPLNPLNLMIPDEKDDLGMAELGMFLKKVLSPAELLRLTDEKSEPILEELGRAYAKRMGQASREWEKGESIENAHPGVIDTVIARYRFCKTFVNDGLKKAGIGAPTLGPDGGVSNNSLSHDEYLTLVTLVWNGEEGRVTALIGGADHKAANIRSALKDAEIMKSTNRVQRIATTISLEEMGSNEMLRRFNVELGPDLRRQYVYLRRAAGGKPFDSADTWSVNPEAAQMFFTNNTLPPSEGNAQFLTALKFYNETKWNAPSPADLKKLQGISPEDVKAALKAMSTNLVNFEEMMKGTSTELEGLRLAKGPAHPIESKAVDIFEYVKDVMAHPIGSIAIATALGTSAYIIVQWLRGKGNLVKNKGWFLAAAAGAVGAGLYQQERGGKAYWDDALDHINAWYRGEKAKPAEQQTMPSMWAERIDKGTGFYENLRFERRHTKACLALLERQKISGVLDWYAQMDAWEQTKEGPMPMMPFNLSAAERSIFGDGTNNRTKNISILMHRTLKSFFADRGRMARAEHEYMVHLLPPGIERKDDAALGLAYIRERYVNRKYFTRLMETAIGGLRIETDPTTVSTTPMTRDPAAIEAEIAKIIEMRPDLKATLEIVRVAYRAELVPVKTADWEMWHVFMTEIDSEAWRRIGRPGAVPASWLMQGVDYGKRLAAASTASIVATRGAAGSAPVLPSVPMSPKPSASRSTPATTPTPAPGATPAPAPGVSSAPGTISATTPAASSSPTATPAPGPTPAPDPGAKPAPGARPTPAPGASPAPGPTAVPPVVELPSAADVLPDGKSPMPKPVEGSDDLPRARVPGA